MADPVAVVAHQRRPGNPADTAIAGQRRRAARTRVGRRQRAPVSCGLAGARSATLAGLSGTPRSIAALGDVLPAQPQRLDGCAVRQGLRAVCVG
uniref:Uncharacterized protein n=1 Tax=Pseudomonas graminis TaxID=158627 RepID=A0A7C1X879_9PSED